MRRVAGFVVAVGVLFAVVTVLKSGAAPDADSIDSATVSPQERERVRRFWEAYRSATEHRITGRSRDAADEYRRALALDPEHLDALYYLGNMEFDLGRFAAAETAWKQMIEIDPTSARAHAQLGTLYFCVGEGQMLQPEKAVAELERAATINREETGPLLSLGEIALVQGDLERAHELFDAVIGSNYSSVEAHFYRGYLSWKSGAVAEAADLLAAAVRHAQPSAPEGDVAGEGDTRAGSAPMVRTPSRCGAMRARADELVRVDGDATLLAGPVYRAFDGWLQEVRGSLP
jgi:tetratricopeptide (TPR) repeat protein